MIKQTVFFNASPTQVYNLLMDSRLHAGFTGNKATISRKVGGKIEAYGGYITGNNIELIEGKKIIQRWHASDWEEGIDSKVTFTFAKSSKGTKMTFTHKGVPKEFVADISQGWKEHYWKPMKEALKK